MLYFWISVDLKILFLNNISKKIDYLISKFKMADGYHGNITLAN